MKGLVLRDMIILIVLLVMFTGSIIFAVIAASKESRVQRAMMSAGEVAGVINLVQASPTGTFQLVSMEKMCDVAITPDKVTVTIDKESASAGIIKTSIAVQPSKLECKNGAAYVMRCENAIKVSQKEKPCES